MFNFWPIFSKLQYSNFLNSKLYMTGFVILSLTLMPWAMCVDCCFPCIFFSFSNVFLSYVVFNFDALVSNLWSFFPVLGVFAAFGEPITQPTIVVLFVATVWIIWAQWQKNVKLSYFYFNLVIFIWAALLVWDIIEYVQRVRVITITEFIVSSPIWTIRMLPLLFLFFIYKYFFHIRKFYKGCSICQDWVATIFGFCGSIIATCIHEQSIVRRKLRKGGPIEIYEAYITVLISIPGIVSLVWGLFLGLKFLFFYLLGCWIRSVIFFDAALKIYVYYTLLFSSNVLTYMDDLVRGDLIFFQGYFPIMTIFLAWMFVYHRTVVKDLRMMFILLVSFWLLLVIPVTKYTFFVFFDLHDTLVNLIIFLLILLLAYSLHEDNALAYFIRSVLFVIVAYFLLEWRVFIAIPVAEVILDFLDAANPASWVSTLSRTQSVWLPHVLLILVVGFSTRVSYSVLALSVAFGLVMWHYLPWWIFFPGWFVADRFIFSRDPIAFKISRYCFSLSKKVALIYVALGYCFDTPDFTALFYHLSILVVTDTFRIWSLYFLILLVAFATPVIFRLPFVLSIVNYYKPWIYACSSLVLFGFFAWQVYPFILKYTDIILTHYTINFLNIVLFACTLLFSFVAFSYSKSSLWSKTLFFILVGLGWVFSMLLLNSSNFLSFYSAIEGLSLSTFFLIARDYLHEGSKELFFKYFCFSMFSSALLLSSILILFILFNSFDFLTLKLLLFYVKLNLFVDPSVLAHSFQLNASTYILVNLSLLFFFLSFFFKLGVFPFHFLVPDIYEVSSILFIMYHSVFVKTVYFLVFFKSCFFLFFDWIFCFTNLFSFSGFLSLFIGALSAFGQRSYWRLLGFASVAQFGLILLGLSCNTSIGLFLSVVFFFNYVLTTICLLSGLLFLVQHPIPFKEGLATTSFYPNGSSKTLALQFQSKIKPEHIYIWVALVSNAALPPTLGFFSKYLLLLEFFNLENIVSFCVIVIINIVSSYYYLNLLEVLIQNFTSGPPVKILRKYIKVFSHPPDVFRRMHHLLKGVTGRYFYRPHQFSTEVRSVFSDKILKMLLGLICGLVFWGPALVSSLLSFSSYLLFYLLGF